MSLHRSSTGQDNIHVIHAFEFADQTEREAGTGYTLTAADVKKVALQLDDYSYWVLTDDSPITWVEIGGSGGVDESGWVASGDTWTYASADDPTFTFTIAGVDRSSILTPGTRIKLTQTTPKYFIVTKVAFSTDTTVTVYGGTDYDLANAAITSPYYSRVKAPEGFPMAPSKWTVKVTDTSNQNQASPVAGTWYNLGSITISIPIGCWQVYYTVMFGNVDGAAVSGIGAKCTLSTANNTESDNEFTGVQQVNGITFATDMYLQQSKMKNLELTSKTSYFLNATSGFTIDSLSFRGDIISTVIQAVCTLL